MRSRPVVRGLAVAAAGLIVPIAAAGGASATGTGPSEPLRGLTDDTIKLGLALLDVERTFSTFGVDLGDPPPPELLRRSSTR